MAELIATGTTLANSADFTLTDGQTCQLALFSGTAGPQLPTDSAASVQNKTSTGGYVEVGTLTFNEPVKILAGPGTFRVVRKICTTSTGVDKS